jgi:hypothetical protein
MQSPSCHLRMASADGSTPGLMVIAEVC